MGAIWIEIIPAFVFAFFIFYFLPEACEHSCQWVPCTVHGTHTTFNVHTLALLWHCQWVSCTVHEIHKSHFSVIFSLKMSHTVLFTHLKIILLQCFQFSVSVIINLILNGPMDTSFHDLLFFFYQ